MLDIISFKQYYSIFSADHDSPVSPVLPVLKFTAKPTYLRERIRNVLTLAYRDLTMVLLADHSSTTFAWPHTLEVAHTRETTYFNLTPRITDICHWIIYLGLCQVICVFGILTNMINIICFLKQGFKDPVNISLLGISQSF